LHLGVYYSAYYDCNWDEDEPVDDGKNGELGGEVGRFTVKTRPKKKRCASPTAYSRKPSLLGDGGQSSAAGGGGRQSIGKKFFFKIARLITAKSDDFTNKTPTN
jgi:hypothetical protein